MRSEGRLDDYLREFGIPGISGVDTRALTRHIREVGDIRAVLVHEAAGLSDDELAERARSARFPAEHDVVGEVSVSDSESLGIKVVLTSWLSTVESRTTSFVRS